MSRDGASTTVLDITSAPDATNVVRITADGIVFGQNKGF